VTLLLYDAANPPGVQTWRNLSAVAQPFQAAMPAFLRAFLIPKRAE
jgi:hypothetical protein